MRILQSERPQIAHKFVDTGADWSSVRIPHLLGNRDYKGKKIYSLGNFIFHHQFYGFVTGPNDPRLQESIFHRIK